MPAVDQPSRESRPNLLPVVTEHRPTTGLVGIVRGVFLLAVKPEWAIKAPKQFGRVLQQPVVNRLKADHPAQPAFPRRPNTKQSHVFRRKIETIVRVELLALVGDRGTHAVSRSHLPAGVANVVHHGAVPLLRDGTRDHVAEQPIELGRGFRPQFVHRQPIDDDEPDSMIERVARRPHHPAARRHVEAIRPENDERQGVGLEKACDRQ